MIEKMKELMAFDNQGFGHEYPPDAFEMMEKINELVEAVNRMEKQIEKLQVL